MKKGIQFRFLILNLNIYANYPETLRYIICLGECKTGVSLEKREINQYSPLALAFLGDSVYERMVRERLILQANRPVGQLHQLTIKRVCASFQSKAVDAIIPYLNEEESDILKRGRNATGTTVPKHLSAIEYRRATSLECLFGYLHLKGDEKRIEEIFNYIWEIEVI